MNNLPFLRSAARAALVVSMSVGFAATGWANSTGYSGASGKDNGFYCRNCHAGGTAPTVAFDGPTNLAPGASATFKFTVTSHSASQVIAGLDVAASAGTLSLIEGQGTRLLLNEVTHFSPKANDANGQASFEFTWQAPASNGTYTLYGAGNSANGNRLQTGDAAARTTYQVVVGAVPPTATPAPPTPTATATATPTQSASACVGDCGGDGEVTVDELITGVNIALGVTAQSACPIFDANTDGETTIDEILQAVNSALNGCPA